MEGVIFGEEGDCLVQQSPVYQRGSQLVAQVLVIGGLPQGGVEE